MGEQHLDLLPLPARDDVGLGLGDGTSLVAGGFIDRAWYLASRSIRAAARLQRAGVAVRLASAVAHGVVLRRCGPWRGERSSVFLQLLAARADVDVARPVVGEVVTREGPILALGFVEHRDVRLLEKVEWSGTWPSSPNRQNQR